MTRKPSPETAGSEPQSEETPAFGEATLNNCEREQIHLPGSIQPHGCLLVLSPADLRVLQASSNAAEFLQNDKVGVGASLQQLDPALAAAVNNLLGSDLLLKAPQILQQEFGDGKTSYDIAVHAPAEEGVILEFELAGSDGDLAGFVERSIQTIVSTLTLGDLYVDAVGIFRDLTGYDRVMLYRFDDEGHGKVIAERCSQGLEPYLGNHYPATDIPQIARRLYETNRIRMLVDVDYTPLPVEPSRSPESGAELDMSMCQLRSVSPIHLQYLRNMGVAGTLVSSLMVGGKLWGLVSCHHYAPRNVSRDVRMAMVVLSEVVATRIAALEGYARAETEIAVRLIEKRIVESIAREGDWKGALFSKSHELLNVINAGGAAMSFEGEIYTDGNVPATQDLKSLVRWLDQHARDRLFSTRSLGLDVAEFETLKAAASGLISVPVSTSGGEYLMWFRPERRQTVTWGGNPEKQVSAENPRDLSPRQSFAKWYQMVEGTADAWSPGELTAAKRIGESVEDIVYQFRAVRFLIAEDQITQLASDVRDAKQPVIVVDRSGQLLLVNDAFYRLLPSNHADLRSVHDIPLLFKNQDRVRDLIEILLRDQHSGRAEVEIMNAELDKRHLALRADPVFVEMGRLLGYVLLFVDVTNRKKIERGKQQFQKSILGIASENQAVPDDKQGVAYLNLLSSALNNAKLAAMEISDDLDFDSVPRLLDSIQDSVSTTGDMLRQLLSRNADRD